MTARMIKCPDCGRLIIQGQVCVCRNRLTGGEVSAPHGSSEDEGASSRISALSSLSGRDALATEPLTAQARRLADAATPSPWTAERFWWKFRSPAMRDGWYWGIEGSDPQGYLATLAVDPDCRTEEDAEFIAAARSLVPALCDEIDRLAVRCADADPKTDLTELRAELAKAICDKAEASVTETAAGALRVGVLEAAGVVADFLAAWHASATASVRALAESDRLGLRVHGVSPDDILAALDGFPRLTRCDDDEEIDQMLTQNESLGHELFQAHGVLSKAGVGWHRDGLPARIEAALADAATKGHLRATFPQEADLPPLVFVDDDGPVVDSPATPFELLNVTPEAAAEARANEQATFARIRASEDAVDRDDRTRIADYLLTHVGGDESMQWQAGHNYAMREAARLVREEWDKLPAVVDSPATQPTDDRQCECRVKGPRCTARLTGTGMFCSDCLASCRVDVGDIPGIDWRDVQIAAYSVIAEHPDCAHLAEQTVHEIAALVAARAAGDKLNGTND